MNHRLVIFLSSLLLIAAVVGGVVYVESWERPIPALGPPSAEAAPTINWAPDKVTETVGQGGQKTKVVSFTSDQNLTNVAVRIVPELQPYVSATPSSFSSISAGATTTITLTLSASAETPLRTFEGTLHLKDNSGKSKKTYAKPLPVTLEVWQRVTEPTTGVSFALPPELSPQSTRFDVEQQEQRTVISVALPSPSDGTFITQFAVTLLPNDAHLSLIQWFQQNVDPSGMLLSAGIVTQHTFSNGSEAIVLMGPTPDEYQDVHGPIPSLYLMSASRSTVAVLAQSHSNELDFYGFSGPDQTSLLLSILETLQLP